MRKISLILIGLSVMLTGCGSAPVNTSTENSTTTPTDPNNPDSFEITRICHDGTKIYHLVGGNANGRYALWMGNGDNYAWVLVPEGASPESVCLQ